MNLKLKEKSVFISGSTAGIGLAVAETFLKEGAIVYINGRTENSVTQGVIALRERVPNAIVQGFPADFSKAEEVQRLMDVLPEIDILINNVGIYSSQSFFETTDQDWYRQFEVNVMSGVRLSRYLLPKMLERNWGRILFVSSECASLVPEDLIAYSTTKTALLAISRGLAQMTKGTKVTVNSVLPGSTMTEGAAQFLSEFAQNQGKSVSDAETYFFETVRPNSLLQRFATVEEVAHTIVYLSSPLASAINGASIKVEGGSTGGVF